MLFDFAKESRWTSRFQSKYPYLRATPADPASLRLILGAGRSGTSWVSQVLGKTTQACRFFSEPLFHIQPRLPFHDEGDHTAIGYAAERHLAILQAAYQLLAHPQFDNPALPGNERNDPGWTICLVKEVHALLGTEALLRAWPTPAIFILRDPVYAIDSLFAAQTVQTIYLDHEVRAVQTEAFLDRFGGGRQEAVRKALADNVRSPQRRRIIIDKLICAQLLQQMFLALASELPRARAFAYEEFCERPLETFPSAAHALGVPWDEAMSGFLQESMHGDAAASVDPYSVRRKTAGQKNRDFKFLQPEEISLCRSTLEAIAARS